MQNHARKYQLPIDTVTYGYNMRDDTSAEEAVQPEDGALIHGLYLEGARWDSEAQIIPHYSLLHTPYSILTTPYSLLHTHYSLLPTHYSLLHTHYSLLHTPYSLLTTHGSLLHTPYSLLPTPYSHY